MADGLERGGRSQTEGQRLNYAGLSSSVSAAGTSDDDFRDIPTGYKKNSDFYTPY